MPAISKEKQIKIASEDAVRSIIPPAPTATWYPASHNEVLNTIDMVLSQNNLHAEDRDYQITQDGHRLFSTMRLRSTQDNDFCYLLGLRTATDKAFSVKLAFGTHVFVCSNGMFSGDRIISRKHTVEVMRDLPGLADTAIKGFLSNRTSQAEQINFWKEEQANSQQAEAFLFNAAYNKTLPFPVISDIWADFNSPRYTEHSKARTVWSLHNAISEHMKERASRNPFSASEEMVALTQGLQNNWPLPANWQN